MFESVRTVWAGATRPRLVFRERSDRAARKDQRYRRAAAMQHPQHRSLTIDLAILTWRLELYRHDRARTEGYPRHVTDQSSVGAREVRGLSCPPIR